MTEPRNRNERYARRVLNRTTEQLRREVAAGIVRPLAPRHTEGAGA